MCGQAVNTSNSGSGGPEPLARCVVSLGKELFSTLSLFTQLYKWLAVTYCWGVILPMDYHPVQGGVAILLGLHHTMETSISSGRVGIWLVYITL